MVYLNYFVANLSCSWDRLYMVQSSTNTGISHTCSGKIYEVLEFPIKRMLCIFRSSRITKHDQAYCRMEPVILNHNGLMYINKTKIVFCLGLNYYRSEKRRQLKYRKQMWSAWVPIKEEALLCSVLHSSYSNISWFVKESSNR